MPAELPIGPNSVRMPDGGPVYTETIGNLDRLLVEPWNAASAALFVVLVLVWVVRLRGKFREYPFLSCCLPLLLAGGIGGTLYHAFRASRVWFLMDVIPILALGVAASVYLWVRLRPRWWVVIALLGAYVAVNRVAFFSALRAGLPVHWAINLHYASLAAFIVLPTFLVLVRTRFRDAGWVYTALVLFAIAWFCRIADTLRPPLLPMGTHWLWHTFGAFAVAALAEYFYRIEGKPLAHTPEEAAGPEPVIQSRTA